MTIGIEVVAVEDRTWIFNTPIEMLAQPQFLQFVMADRRRVGVILVRSIAWLVAALTVAWVISGWFWDIAAPDPVPKSVAVTNMEHQAAAQAIATRHLLGLASSGGDDARADGNSVHLELMGAMTASPKAAGFAILSENGKPSVAAVEGETFMPGVTLVEVLPNQVRLRIGERIETIDMKERTAPSARPAAERTTAASSADGVSGRTPPQASRPNRMSRPTDPRP